MLEQLVADRLSGRLEVVPDIHLYTSRTRARTLAAFPNYSLAKEQQTTIGSFSPPQP